MVYRNNAFGNGTNITGISMTYIVASYTKLWGPDCTAAPLDRCDALSTCMTLECNDLSVMTSMY